VLTYAVSVVSLTASVNAHTTIERCPPLIVLKEDNNNNTVGISDNNKYAKTPNSTNNAIFAKLLRITKPNNKLTPPLL